MFVEKYSKFVTALTTCVVTKIATLGCGLPISMRLAILARCITKLSYFKWNLLIFSKQRKWLAAESPFTSILRLVQMSWCLIVHTSVSLEAGLKLNRFLINFHETKRLLPALTTLPAWSHINSLRLLENFSHEIVSPLTLKKQVLWVAESNLNILTWCQWYV